MSESSRKRKHKRSSKEEETSKNRLHSDSSKRRHNDKYSSHSKRHREQASHVEKESRQIKKARYKLYSREDKDKRRRVPQIDVVDSKTNSASDSHHNRTPPKAESRSVRKADVANGKETKEHRTRSRSPNIRNSDTDHRKKEKCSIYSSDKKSLHVSKSKSQTDVLDSKTNSAADSQHNSTPLKVESRSVQKADVANGSEIKEQRTRSRSPNINNSDTDHRRKEKCSIYSSDKNSLHVSTSKSKKMGTSPTYASEEQGKKCLGFLKSKQKDIEIQISRNDSKTAEKEKESKTAEVKESKTGIVKVTSHESEELLLKERKIFGIKKFTDSTKQHSSISTKSKVSFKIAKALHAIPKIFSPPTPVHSNFKIPKKVKPGLAETNTTETNTTGTSDVTKTSKNGTCTNEQPVSEASTNSVAVPLSFVNAPATSCDAIAEETFEQMQVAEKLHLARTEKLLEVDIMQSYGELTCMDIDPTEESTTYSLSEETAQQAVILVLDTNILLSHLDYVKNMQKRGIGALGIPVVLIPWVVLQELDSLKKGKGFKDCVAHLACPAISYIYNSLKRRDHHLWGQSMQQAAQSNNSLMAENNDDKVLQCCLQYQSLYPGRVLILCTNDKNLCSKAVLSGVKAFSKIDLEAEVEHSQSNLNYLQSTVLQRLPQINMPMCSPIPERCTQAPSLTEVHLSLCLPEEERKSPAVEETKINKCISEFEECLQEVLSNVLENEMKASYDDLWKEIIYKPPPWNLLDILQCLKKHWIAVFGSIVPRFLLQTVLNLINFFRKGQSKDLSSTLLTLQEAKEFVKAFGKRSKHVPKALTAMEKIVQKLQTQPESDVCDVVMNEEDEAKQPPSAHVPHHEVWAMFENIWCKVCEISLEVFKVLAFDPHTRQSALPVGGPAPPQDAMLCLSQISSTVSQLLQAFISVLSPSHGLEEVQVLLSMIRSNKIVDVDFRLVDTDLLSCFSQQDYRDKLGVGVNQLKELKDALDHCIQVMGLQVRCHY
ncbi:transcriptional protein SWT1 [Stigmatopora nigra]